MINVRMNGFTFIEVLVTIVVLGLLGTSLFQGTRLGLAAWATTARRQHDLMLKEAAEQLLRDIISRMIRRVDGTTSLTGTQGSMAFYSRSREPTPIMQATRLADGQTAIAIGLDASHRLLLRELIADRDKFQETVLLNDVVRLTIGYWRADSWLSEWRSVDLPRLVRIEYRLQGREGRQWPPMIIAVPRPPEDQ